jgi:long-chain acyl-CoA synthetase
MATKYSIVHGVKNQPLSNHTLSSLLKAQADDCGDQDAIISWTGLRYTYKDLYQRSLQVAEALYVLGVREGDHVAIFAENCEVYVVLIFANALLSAVTVVMNSNYTPTELVTALSSAGNYMSLPPFTGH